MDSAANVEARKPKKRQKELSYVYIHHQLKSLHASARCVESAHTKEVHYFHAQQLGVAKGQLANTDSCSTHTTEVFQQNNERVIVTTESVKSPGHGKKERYA